MAFDVEGARKAGYSDAEIAAHLAQQHSFDLSGAKKSGYSDGEVIAHLASKAASAAASIPGIADPRTGQEMPKPAPAQPQPDPTIAQRLVGAGEAGLATVTGIVGAPVGAWGGTLKGLSEQILSGKFGTQEAAELVQRSAMEGAAALTYAPRTEQGQEQVRAVGQVLEPLAALGPMAPGMLPAAAVPRGAPVGVTARAAVEGVARAAAGEKGAAAVARGTDAVARVAAAAKSGATTLPRRALEAIQKPEPKPTPGTMASVGAAGTDMATQRIAAAESLPVPVKLTKGQSTRDPAQLKFEVETAKLPEQGAPLRERYVQQNDAILRNFDAFIDNTGAEAPTLRAVGTAVDRALVEQAKRDKTQVRAMYKAAESAGELEAPVTLESVVWHLTDAAPEAATAPLLNVARAKAIQLGIAVEQGGQLVPRPVPLKTAEIYRQAINRATDFEATNVRQATIIKGLVDEATAGRGGDLYKQARAARARYAQNYEDRAAVAKLLSTKKGSSDRAVAFEDVFDHVVLKGSLDDVRNVRRVLHRSGSDGHQAWRELQGATVKWIKDEATKNVATDSAGNRVISPAGLDKAIRALDHDGRLEFVFGKRGAQQLRDINDLAKVAKTVPPEAGVNTSNTASTLLAAFGDILLSGSTGTPVPVATASRLALRHVRDVKLRRRISEALDEIEKKQAPGKKKPPVVEPRPETLH